MKFVPFGRTANDRRRPRFSLCGTTIIRGVEPYGLAAAIGEWRAGLSAASLTSSITSLQPCTLLLTSPRKNADKRNAFAAVPVHLG
jgi:hypothetical protein